MIYLDGQSLGLEDVYAVAHGSSSVGLAPGARKAMESSRNFVITKAREGEALYGITTGLGALSNTSIAQKDLETLQFNLIRSHCAGVGRPLPRKIVRAMMLLRANSLARGYSGINPEVLDLLLDFLNNDVTPVVPEKGSVGASGDLAPLAHMALCLIGEGEVTKGGETMKAKRALGEMGKTPAVLGPKDGLALINGTGLMAAQGSLALAEAQQLAKVADVAGAMSLDGMKGSLSPFDLKIASLRPFSGHKAVCQNINALLKGSAILDSHKDCPRIQDSYSLRCIPQVHGATRETLRHARDIFSVEINAVTDNPIIFAKDNEVLSGGNFHGAPLSLALDYMALGVSELGSISERRIEKMMNKEFSDLPPFLSPDSGHHSGLMIVQVTAAALASENKILCHPASIDTIPTSTDKEDHVSMGPVAGRKLLEILFNVKHILAMEFLCATQAIDFQRPLKTSDALEACHKTLREVVPPIREDRVFKNDIDRIVRLISSGALIEAVENRTGKLL